MTRRTITNTSSAELRSATPASSRSTIIKNRQANFVLSLCTGAAFFALGVILGFTTAIYKHSTNQLSMGIGLCLLAILLSSLRLPIVYQMFRPEAPTAWRDDTSWSLTVAIAVNGLAGGLSLPAEMMLVEICLNDPAELGWERGGWICILYGLVPLIGGIVACVGDLREESAKRERYTRLRRNIRLGGKKEGESVVLLVGEEPE